MALRLFSLLPMPINVATDVWPIVEGELSKLLRKHEKHADAIDDVILHLQSMYGNRVLDGYEDMLDLCPLLREDDLVRSLPIEVQEDLQRIRQRIASRFAGQQPQLEQLGVKDIDPNAHIRNDLLQADIEQSEKDLIVRKPRKALDHIVQDYLDLAAQLGETQFMQVLLRMGILEKSDIKPISKILRSYLGKSKGGGGGFGGPAWIFKQHPDILRDPDVHTLVHRLLRQAIYTELRTRGCDEMSRHTITNRSAGQIARNTLLSLCRQAVVDPKRHEGLISLQEQQFSEITELSPGPHMVDSITYNNVTHPFPSLRQKIAIAEIEKLQHLYVGFEPGLGKTAIALWLWKRVNDQRKTENLPPVQMCYIAPSKVVRELAQTVHNYFTEGNTPSVGVISGGIPKNKRELAMHQDILFVSSSILLSQKKNDDPIYTKLMKHRHGTTDQPFGILMVDEAHEFKGDKTMTDMLEQLVSGIPKLRSDGHIVFMSGTPATNDLSDIIVQMGVLEDTREGKVTRNADVAQLDPIVLRNRLERVLILDPPIPWQHKVEPWPYRLSSEEELLVRSIVEDETLHFSQKKHLVLRAIRTPDLASGNPDIPCSLYEWLETSLDGDLKKYPTILIAEHIHAQGVLRGFDGGTEDHEVEQLLFIKIEDVCSRWSKQNGIPVHFHTIHSEISFRDREQAFAHARESALNPQASRTVIMPHASCVDLGMDLRCIKAMYSLQYPHNMPRLQQLLMRSLRAGHEDIFMRVFFAIETLEEGMYDYAKDKYARIMGCLYERNTSDKELKWLSEQDDSGLKSKKIRNMLTSPERHLEKREQYLHGRGKNFLQTFWSKHLKEFRDDVANEDIRGAADRNRCIAALVAELEKRKMIQPGIYIHTHSQGLTLQRMLDRIQPNKNRHIVSMDALQEMLDIGRVTLDSEERNKIQTAVGTPLDLGRMLRDPQSPVQPGRSDAVILEGLECMHAGKTRKKFNQRTRTIINAVRSLKEGGTFIVPLSRTTCTQEEFSYFCSLLECFGLKLRPTWSGEVQSQENNGDTPFRMFIAVAQKVSNPPVESLPGVLDATALKFTHKHHWGETRERTRIEKERRYRKLPYALIHQQFSVGTHTFGTSLSMPEQAKQQVHLAALQQAVAFIRSLASNPEQFKIQSKEIRDQLRANGIEFLRNLSPTKHRLAFRLRKYPHHFYPYDPQWNTEKES